MYIVHALGSDAFFTYVYTIVGPFDLARNKAVFSASNTIESGTRLAGLKWILVSQHYICKPRW